MKKAIEDLYDQEQNSINLKKLLLLAPCKVDVEKICKEIKQKDTA